MTINGVTLSKYIDGYSDTYIHRYSDTYSRLKSLVSSIKRLY